jgi:hypothetical protein
LENVIVQIYDKILVKSCSRHFGLIQALFQLCYNNESGANKDTGLDSHSHAQKGFLSMGHMNQMKINLACRKLEHGTSDNDIFHTPYVYM